MRETSPQLKGLVLQMVRKYVAGIIAAVVVSAAATSASANTVAFTFDKGDGDHAAKVVFDDGVAGKINITLWNIATNVSTNPTLLSGVYWSTSDIFKVTSLSVGFGTLYNSKTMTFTGNGVSSFVPTNSGSDVGIFAFGEGKKSTVADLYGVTSTDVNIDASVTDRNTKGSLGYGNKDKTADGPNGGIATYNTPVTEKAVGSNGEAIRDSLVYSLAYTGSFNVDNIKSVYFLYGATSFSTTFKGASEVRDYPIGSDADEKQPLSAPVPLPAAVWSGLALMVALVAGTRLRRKLQAA